jgi:hypothetical protein
MTFTLSQAIQGFFYIYNIVAFLAKQEFHIQYSILHTGIRKTGRKIQYSRSLTQLAATFRVSRTSGVYPFTVHFKSATCFLSQRPPSKRGTAVYCDGETGLGQRICHVGTLHRLQPPVGSHRPHSFTGVYRSHFTVTCVIITDGQVRLVHLVHLQMDNFYLFSLSTNKQTASLHLLAVQQ